jgi:hypothetical protein
MRERLIQTKLILVTPLTNQRRATPQSCVIGEVLAFAGPNQPAPRDARSFRSHGCGYAKPKLPIKVMLTDKRLLRNGLPAQPFSNAVRIKSRNFSSVV